MESDLLDMEYINSLPQPFLGKTLNGGEWPIVDIEVQTGLVRIDVCGKLEVKTICDFKEFRDDIGVIHPAYGFFSDAIPEERAAKNVTSWLFEHEDGRTRIWHGDGSPKFTHNNPSWHRVGPVLG